MTTLEIIILIVSALAAFSLASQYFVWAAINDILRQLEDLDKAFDNHKHPKLQSKTKPPKIETASGTMTPAMKHAISLGGASVKIHQFPDMSFRIYSVDAEGGETEMYLCPRCGQYGFPTSVISDDVCTACANEIRGAS